MLDCRAQLRRQGIATPIGPILAGMVLVIRLLLRKVGGIDVPRYVPCYIRKPGPQCGERSSPDVRSIQRKRCVEIRSEHTRLDLVLPELRLPVDDICPKAVSGGKIVDTQAEPNLVDVLIAVEEIVEAINGVKGGVFVRHD